MTNQQLSLTTVSELHSNLVRLREKGIDTDDTNIYFEQRYQSEQFKLSIKGNNKTSRYYKEETKIKSFFTDQYLPVAAAITRVDGPILSAYSYGNAFAYLSNLDQPKVQEVGIPYQFSHMLSVNLYVITEPFKEHTVGDVTYRSVMTNNYEFVFSSDDPIYNYLDVGAIFGTAYRGNKIQYSICRELNFQTIKISALLQLNPDFFLNLTDHCIIELENTENLLARFEKRNKNKEVYDQLCETWFIDYQKAGNRKIINKLISKEISEHKFRDIVFNATSATYHTISIVADDLFTHLNTFNFEQEIDIYGVIQFYLTKKIDKLLKDRIPTIPFVINGINIHVEKYDNGDFYKVNRIRINKKELISACFRASCLNNQKDFEDFLDRVSYFSLKYTEYVANGMPVKTSPLPNHRDFVDRPLNDPIFPKLRFKMENRKVRLILEPGVDVLLRSFPEFVRSVESTNNHTTGGYTRGYNYARTQIVRNIREQANKYAVTEVKDVTGKVISVTKTFVSSQIADKKIDLEKYFENTLEKDAKEAREKSKQFLAAAIDATKAQEITYKGEVCFLVQGSKTQYRVMKDSAKVYNHINNSYICIVNSRHYQGVGFDDVAARLYALKNDSVMQNKIGTLRHV